MHILGLCNGSIHGNSEILLKAALKAATASDPSISVSWMHVPSIAWPLNHKPIKSDPSIIPNRDDDAIRPTPGREPDDREAAFNAIMEADALIIATPVYSHQPAGTLKALADAILGPYADVSGSYRLQAQQQENLILGNKTETLSVKIDQRDLKPRVAGFLAVAGSDARFPEQWTMALPTLHSITYPLHARVIDQAIFPGFATAGAVLLDPKATITRAELLGRRVASQIGRPYDDAEYLGKESEEDGSCPYCHQLKIEFRQANHVVCIVCGANGILTARPGGQMRPVWESTSAVSCMTLQGKWKHLDDIHEKLNGERKMIATIADELGRWKRLEFPEVDLPSRRLAD